MSLQYNIVERDGMVNVTVVLGGGLLVADEEHPNIEAILEKVRAGDSDGLEDLFDASHRAAARFENLSERVSVANSRVYVDGDEVSDVIAKHIVRFLDEEDESWEALVKFLEKLYTNTEPHTRDNLYRWLDATGSFTIDETGDIVGYKGLRQDKTSVRSGPAVVNGEAVNDHVPNEPGSVVEMARSKVEHNPSVGCASGLHVGTWEYAHGFGHGVVVKVAVNPRDVVSVPTDCDGQKMRVARYRVVAVVDKAHEEAVVPDGFEPSEDYVEGYEDGYDDSDLGLDANPQEAWADRHNV